MATNDFGTRIATLSFRTLQGGLGGLERSGLVRGAEAAFGTVTSGSGCFGWEPLSVFFLQNITI
jgi:hypothetical protein